MTPYLFALMSNFCFGASSLVFSRFALRYGPTFVNHVKVTVAGLGFTVASVLLVPMPTTWDPVSGFIFVLSGFFGLYIGDYFLFKAFTLLGPSRTLMLFGFQPVLLGLYGTFAMDQEFPLSRFIAIAFFIACLILFSVEQSAESHQGLEKKSQKRIAAMALATAFVGLLFDAGGVILSREGFNRWPEIHPLQANALRAYGALFGFLVLSWKGGRERLQTFKNLPILEKRNLIAASFFGTFLSLSLYLLALKSAHLGTLSGIAITGPLWASLFEHLLERKRPKKTFWIALLCFSIGFFFAISS